MLQLTRPHALTLHCAGPSRASGHGFAASKGDVIAVSNIDGRVAAPAVVQSLTGKTVDEVVGLLSQVEPDNLALKYSELRPDARYQAVLAEIRGSQEPDSH